MKKGGAAAEFSLKKGMELLAVGATMTPTYDGAIAAIQAAGRPVTMTFKKLPSSKDEADHQRAAVPPPAHRFSECACAMLCDASKATKSMLSQSSLCAQVTANTLLAKDLEQTYGEMTPLRAVFEEERESSMGQWLRQHNIAAYASAFMNAGCALFTRDRPAFAMASPPHHGLYMA